MKEYRHSSALPYIVAILLALVASIGVQALPVAAARMSARAAAGRILYKASWNHSLNAWQPTDSGWKVKHHALIYSGKPLSNITAAIAPFQTSGVTSFAVQARIRAIRPGLSLKAAEAKNTIMGFGITGHAPSGSSDVAPVVAGYIDYPGSSVYTGAGMVWEPAGDTHVTGTGGAAFKPRKRWHTYRLEISGSLYRLLIDGHVVVDYTKISGYTSFQSVAIWSIDYKIAVKSFEVLALPTPNPTTIVDTDALRAAALTPADFPAGMSMTLDWHHFMSNAEYARANKVDVAGLERAGRIAAYDESLQNEGVVGIFEVDDSVAVHTSTPAAQARFDAFVSGLSSGQKPTTYSTLTVVPVGSRTFSYGFDDTFQSRTIHVEELDFVEGAYWATITVVAWAGTIDPVQQQAELEHLAQVQDAHIKAAGQ